MFLFWNLSLSLKAYENYENLDEYIQQIEKSNKKINTEESFVFFSKFFEESTPESFKYINLNFYGIEKWSKIEKALKILIYNNKIPNLNIDFWKILKHDLKAINFYKISEKILGTGFSEDTIKARWSENIDINDLSITKQSYEIIKNKDFFEKQFNENSIVKPVLDKVFDIIINEHYDKEKFDKNEIYYSAIKWITTATWDKHTVFFPPTESKDFLSNLAWDFEWIWAYIDMPEPGIFKITSPILWGPADKAWIKWWDIILEVDSKKVTEKNSQNEIVSWIKWKAGSKVDLKIQRWNEIFNLKVTREKVHIKSIETEFNGNNFIIKISGFNENVANEFKEALNELKARKDIKKIIIDLRNNGGGYLDEVSEILWFVIEKWSPVVHVKYLHTQWDYLSNWANLIDLNNYELVFLQNWWTASASEIMIWTIKDYFQNTKIIWEKSYGKWSVQTIKEFDDWSSLKFTTAKWFTWKSKTWIDWIWITPDIKLEFNENNFKNFGIDNQLERALSI